MFRWLTARGATRRRVEMTSARIGDAQWRDALRRHPFLVGLTPDEQQALRQRTAWLLASKSFNGAQGLQVTDAMMLSIAVQAALPILALDPGLYAGWHEIIVYPGGFLIPRSDVDDSGVVHEYLQPASGEAWEGGPVILSWEDVDQTDMGYADNVVIHEFAHKLDLHAGDADGVPYLGAHPHLRTQQWRKVLQASYESFNHALDQIEQAIPSHVDPESDAAAPWYEQLPLDPYAATDEAEFFAVSSEAFFVDPEPLARSLPQWYGLLAGYYRQDPLQRQLAVGAEPTHG